MGFYADKMEKAVALALTQQKDGWPNDDIERYWVILEGAAFAKQVMEHLN